MKIFISWSGEPSRRVATLLRKYLPCMIQELDPFMSQHDLSSGGRWAEQLSKELDDSNFGIICLTPGNLQEPWILFEAGALTKHVEGRACCLLLRGLGPADISGPLSQFQNRIFTCEEFYKLLVDINKLVGGRLGEANLKLIFDKWWVDLDKEVTTALNDPKLDAPIEHKRNKSDILEEVLLRVRNLERSLQSGSSEKTPIRFLKSTKPDWADKGLASLSPTQMSILRDLVSPYGTTLSVDYDLLVSKYSSADVDLMIGAGWLVRQNSGNVEILNPALAAYLTEKQGWP